MDKKQHWLVRPHNIKRLWIAFIVILVLMVIPGLFLRPHAYFGLDGSFGFFAWYGFAACAAIVIIARLLGFFLKRGDTYYHND